MPEPRHGRHSHEGPEEEKLGADFENLRQNFIKALADYPGFALEAAAPDISTVSESPKDQPLPDAAAQAAVDRFVEAEDDEIAREDRESLIEYLSFLLRQLRFLFRNATLTQENIDQILPRVAPLESVFKHGNFPPLLQTIDLDVRDSIKLFSAWRGRNSFESLRLREEQQEILENAVQNILDPHRQLGDLGLSNLAPHEITDILYDTEAAELEIEGFVTESAAAAGDAPALIWELHKMLHNFNTMAQAFVYIRTSLY